MIRNGNRHRLALDCSVSSHFTIVSEFIYDYNGAEMCDIHLYNTVSLMEISKCTRNLNNNGRQKYGRGQKRVFVFFFCFSWMVW